MLTSLSVILRNYASVPLFEKHNCTKTKTAPKL